jgi:hypothetical protein
MRIGGQYIGLGLGDSSEEIRRIKAYMRGKFSYAKNLADTTLYDQAMVVAVTEMQTRYNAGFGQLATGKYTPGVINVETKVVMGFIPRPPKLDNRPMLFSVCGTGVPWWIGPDADTARAVEVQYRWQPIGYSAKAVPMGGSISEGKAELEKQINIHRDQVMRCGAALLGYSQGAIVASELFMEQIRPENGRLRWAYPKIIKACMWGNPCRQRGQVWPDSGGPPSPLANGGVTGNLMTDTPKWWIEFAHKGDLYSDCPPDESSENRTAIWQLIRNGDIMTGPDSLLRQVLELGGLSRDAGAVSETTGMVKAMLDALVFFGKKTGPHINYSPAEAIAYLRG